VQYAAAPLRETNLEEEAGHPRPGTTAKTSDLPIPDHLKSRNRPDSDAIATLQCSIDNRDVFRNGWRRAAPLVIRH
jgi:hypothetical protein